MLRSSPSQAVRWIDIDRPASTVKVCPLLDASRGRPRSSHAMLRRPFLLGCLLSAASPFLLSGCQPSELGTIGPETRKTDGLPTGADPKTVKGKDKPASNIETTGTRK